MTTAAADHETTTPNTGDDNGPATIPLVKPQLTLDVDDPDLLKLTFSGSVTLERSNAAHCALVARLSKLGHRIELSSPLSDLRVEFVSLASGQKGKLDGDAFLQDTTQAITLKATGVTIDPKGLTTSEKAATAADPEPEPEQ